jgi:hypothetical protein
MLLQGPIENKIYAMIQGWTYSSQDEVCGIPETSEKITLYVEELMRLAYAAGVQSMEEGKVIPWMSFEEWITKIEYFM